MYELVLCRNRAKKQGSRGPQAGQGSSLAGRTGICLSLHTYAWPRTIFLHFLFSVLFRDLHVCTRMQRHQRDLEQAACVNGTGQTIVLVFSQQHILATSLQNNTFTRTRIHGRSVPAWPSKNHHTRCAHTKGAGKRPGAAPWTWAQSRGQSCRQWPGQRTLWHPCASVNALGLLINMGPSVDSACSSCT